MNRKHLLPAAVALAVHVFLLFGFPTRRVPVAPAPDEPIVLHDPIVQRPVEDPPAIDLVVTGEPAGAEEPVPVPGLPEPDGPPREIGITIPIPPRDLPPPGPPVTAIPSNVGVPGGSGLDLLGPRARILDASLLDNRPQATFQPPPAYPFEQKRLGISGTVTVTFTVDSTGRVRGAYVVSSDPAGFDEAALRAVSRWRFEPGRKNGRTVPFRMTVPILFNIQNEP